MRIEEAQDLLSRRLMGRAGVEAIGIGEHDGAPCLRVYVSRPTSELDMPADVGGHPVRVKETAPFRALEGGEG